MAVTKKKPKYVCSIEFTSEKDLSGAFSKDVTSLVVNQVGKQYSLFVITNSGVDYEMDIQGVALNCLTHTAHTKALDSELVALRSKVAKLEGSLADAKKELKAALKSKTKKAALF